MPRNRAKIYSNWRNLALFSQTAFRRKLHLLEAAFIAVVCVGQIVFYIVIIATPEDLSYKFQVRHSPIHQSIITHYNHLNGPVRSVGISLQLANQYALGIVSFFLAIAPLSLFITLRYACKPKIVPSVIPPSGTVNKLIFLVCFWALGRFTRAVDALSSFRFVAKRALLRRGYYCD